MNDFVKILLEAPDSQIDSTIKPLIEKWDEQPTPIQILEVLDHCIHASLASGMVVQVLQIIYADACKKNNTSHEEVVKFATWRNS